MDKSTGYREHRRKAKQHFLKRWKERVDESPRTSRPWHRNSEIRCPGGVTES